MREENRIDYVELPAKDLQLAKTFFKNTFGWTFEDYGPEYCSFSDGRLDGGFFKSTSVASTDNGSALLVFYAKDLEAAVEHITANGGSVVRDIFSFPGGRRFHFADPNGNEYAIWSEN